MSSLKIDNATINRVFDYIIKNNYNIKNKEKRLQQKYANEFIRRKKAIENIASVTNPIDLL